MNKSRELKSKSAADEFNLEIQRNNNWGNKEGSGGL